MRMASKYLPLAMRSLSRQLYSSRLLASSSTLTHTSYPKDSSFLQKHNNITIPARQIGIFNIIKEKVGLKSLRYRRKDLHHAGMRLYMCCTDIVNAEHFISQMDMPDTFDSWFRIIELHTWLVMVRLAAEGEEGKHVRNSMSEFLWKDVDKRSKYIGSGASSSSRRESIKQLSYEFRIALFSYDEGMLSDDRVLAGALWRTFFEKRIVEPAQLESMVAYVRKQLHHLHDQNTTAILHQGLVTFLPLYGDELDENKTQKLLNSIISRT